MEAMRVSKDLKLYLDCNLQEILTVHSIFSSAINLIDQQGNLVTLLLDTKVIGPMTALVNVSQRELSNIHPEDKVLIISNGLLFQRNNLFVSTQNAEMWDQGVQLQGKQNDLGIRREQLRIIRQVILDEESSIGIGALISQFDFEDLNNWKLQKSQFNNPYCDFILDPLTGLLEAVIADDEDRFLGLLPKFIGFGPGLTPSTDDFLAGLMISIYYDTAVKDGNLDNKMYFLGLIYQMALGRTTVISENMLKLTALGYVSEDYRALIRGVFFESEEPIQKLVQRVMKHGASSGSDFMFGFYCMTAIRDSKSVKEA